MQRTEGHAQQRYIELLERRLVRRTSPPVPQQIAKPQLFCHSEMHGGFHLDQSAVTLSPLRDMAPPPPKTALRNTLKGRYRLSKATSKVASKQGGLPASRLTSFSGMRGYRKAPLWGEPLHCQQGSRRGRSARIRRGAWLLPLLGCPSVHVGSVLRLDRRWVTPFVKMVIATCCRCPPTS